MALTLISQDHKHQKMSATAVDASGTNSSDAFDATAFKTLTVQVVHASHSDTSTWELQSSADGGSNYDTIADTSTTTSGASGSAGVHLVEAPNALIRLTVTETDANGSATLTPYFVATKQEIFMGTMTIINPGAGGGGGLSEPVTLTQTLTFHGS